MSPIHGARTGALVLACIGITACSATPTPTSSPPTVPTAPTSPGGGSPTAPATATPAATVSLSQCPAAPLPASSLAVLRRGGQPDDLDVDAAGDLWISDASATVVRVSPNDGATVLQTLRSLADPEGMVPLPGGSLLVAEQGADRVEVVAGDGARSTLLTLPPHPTAQLGLDGIALDATGSSVLVPDSPHGTLLTLPVSAPAGSTPTQLADGLGRPVGVVAAPDGTLYVAAENEAPRGLLRVIPGRPVAPVGAMAQLDDVVFLHGLLYATDLRARVVRAVDPRTGAQRAIATFSGQPQGLAVLADGRLAVADPDSGEVLALPACG